MRSRWILVPLFCAGWSLMITTVEAVEPISTSLAVGILSALTGFLDWFPDALGVFQECCGPEWISYNKTGLEADLKSKLFGQHIASRVILKAVTGFMNNENTKKPLVLSLHGLTGTGKNFVSQIIAKNIYRNRMKSRFVHLFIATVHFPHEAELELYKSQLQQWIKGNVSACPRSMFIFDEMDKMHPGLIDSIKHYLDYHETLDGVSYHKAIFIFLSNAGGNEIMQMALNFWKAGWDREEIELKDLEEDLSLSVFNNKYSGFWHTNLIDKNLVDFFVPFLPLEYKYVVQCGRAEMINKGLKANEEAVERMALKMNYFHCKERVFAAQGCKVISSKLDFYI